MIEVIKVENKEQEKDFVMFPFKLYKGCDYWAVSYTHLRAHETQ